MLQRHGLPSQACTTARQRCYDCCTREQAPCALSRGGLEVGQRLLLLLRLDAATSGTSGSTSSYGGSFGLLGCRAVVWWHCICVVQLVVLVPVLLLLLLHVHQSWS